MTRRFSFGVVAVICVLALVACGGGGPPDPNALHDIDVQVSFPGGMGVGSATVTTPYGAAPLTMTGSGSGKGKASLTEHGAVVASVEAGATALLFGFVDDDHTTLDATTTAVVMAFYYLQGQYLEPAMQVSLVDWLSRQPAVLQVAAAVAATLVSGSPQVSIDEPGIAAALAAMADSFAPAGDGAVTPLNLTISPDQQTSGIYVRETGPFLDVITVSNAFRRPVHVFVERDSPSYLAVTDFPLDGAAIEEQSVARSFQHFTGFQQGTVPRSAFTSPEVAVPGTEDGDPAVYLVTVVGAGGDHLSSVPSSAIVQTAKDVAMRTAVERFLAPTIAAALELGAAQRLAERFDPILAGLSQDTIAAIEQGDFAAGVTQAFAELFSSAALGGTVQRLIDVYYPAAVTRDDRSALVARLTRTLSPLVGATASSVSTNRSGIISTIKQSKRVETFVVVARPVKLRVSPRESTIGTGGEVLLTTDVRVPEGANVDDLTFRYSLSGALAGYATDGGTDRAFPFETDSTVITYKHRDTINVAYGTDTVTVEAIQVVDGSPTVVATGTATVTVKESTITLTPATATLDFGEEQTFTATVDPLPASGTLSYVFVTYGKSTFVGGSQTSIGPSDSVVFVEADDVEGAEQPVSVTVVLDDEGEQTVLGQAYASATFSSGNEYVLAGSPDGMSGILVDDALTVKLDGVVIYTDGMASSGMRDPISFTAEKGSRLRFEVWDRFGFCRVLTTVYLVKGNLKTVADPGLPGTCGHPSGDQGIVHTFEFVIPF